jgi:hypothetical protein
MYLLDDQLKGVANNMDKFVPKLATICKLLHAVGSLSWIRTGILIEALAP